MKTEVSENTVRIKDDLFVEKPAHNGICVKKWWQ